MFLSPKPQEQTIKKTEMWFVFATIGVALTVSGLSSYFAWGWTSAATLAYGLYAIMLVYAFVTRSIFLKNIFLFSTASGFVELFADWWLVEGTKTLVYFPDEPFIWKSPAYMPFAWAVVLTQAGYLGWFIKTKYPVLQTVLFTGLIGASMIPIHEYCAHNALWWYYKDCKVIFHTPYYIILGEGLICAALPLLYLWLNTKKNSYYFLAGIAHGLWIWISYLIAYSIFE